MLDLRGISTRVEIHPPAWTLRSLFAIDPRPRARGSRFSLYVDANCLRGDGPPATRHCLGVADWARRHGYVAIESGETLAVYPENRPEDLDISVSAGPFALNYGASPYVDSGGFPARSSP